MPNTDLCRGWTEPDIRRSVAMANDDQAAILREIAGDDVPVTLGEIAQRLGERLDDLEGRMSAWARKTNTLGVFDPGTPKPSWPWAYDARPGGNAYLVPQRVREIILDEVGEVPRHRSFVTLWSKKQLAHARASSSQGEPLNYAASSQFRKVGLRAGDHVYVVGTDRGDLLLVGRLVVSDVMDLREAENRFGTDVYDAPDHIAGMGTTIDLDRRVPRATVAQLERFSGRPFSAPGSDGVVTGNGMRATGRITAASAQLLDSLLDTAIQVPVVEPQNEELTEGRRLVVLQEQVERSAAARARAIAIRGTDCMACGFSFGAAYGELGAGFVEVHHLAPIASAGVRAVDPRTDLVVLCANCHSMVHRKEPPLMIQGLQGHMR